MTFYAIRVNIDIAGVAPEVEDSIPAVLPINSDDDNSNMAADASESNMNLGQGVIGENDLIPVFLSVEPRSIGGTVTIRSLGEYIGVFDENNKKGALLLGHLQEGMNSHGARVGISRKLCG